MPFQTTTSSPLIEHGTFIPNYAAENGNIGTISYAFQAGKYYKIGNLVHIWVELATSSFIIPTPVVIPNLLYVEMPGAPVAWGTGTGLGATTQTMQCNNWYGYDGASIYHPHAAAIQRGTSRVLLGNGRHTLPNPANGAVFNAGDAYNNDFVLVTSMTTHAANLNFVRNECRFTMTYITPGGGVWS